MAGKEPIRHVVSMPATLTTGNACPRRQNSRDPTQNTTEPAQHVMVCSRRARHMAERRKENGAYGMLAVCMHRRCRGSRWQAGKDTRQAYKIVHACDKRKVCADTW